MSKIVYFQMFFSKYEWNDDGRENFPGAVWGHAWLSRGHHHHQLLFLLQLSLFTTPLILSSIVLPIGDTTPILSHFFSKLFFLQLRSFPDITILCSFSHFFFFFFFFRYLCWHPCPLWVWQGFTLATGVSCLSCIFFFYSHSFLSLSLFLSFHFLSSISSFAAFVSVVRLWIAFDLLGHVCLHLL